MSSYLFESSSIVRAASAGGNLYVALCPLELLHERMLNRYLSTAHSKLPVVHVESWHEDLRLVMLGIMIISAKVNENWNEFLQAIGTAGSQLPLSAASSSMLLSALISSCGTDAGLPGEDSSCSGEGSAAGFSGAFVFCAKLSPGLTSFFEDYCLTNLQLAAVATLAPTSCLSCIIGRHSCQTC